MSDRRVEKDLLIDNLRDVINGLRACRDTLDECHEAGKISAKGKSAILGVFRRLANSLENFEAVLEVSQMPKSLTGKAKAIRNTFYELKAAATGGDSPSRPYTRKAISDQEQAYRILNAKLQELIFQINKES